MPRSLEQFVRWFKAVWADDANAHARVWRRHVRGLMICWALTASAMVLLGLYPNEADLSMYGMLLAQELPWQQQLLAAVEIAAPLLMAWHLIGLQRWGQRRLNEG